MSQENIKDLLELISKTDIEELKYKNNKGDFLYLHIKRLSSVKPQQYEECLTKTENEKKINKENSKKIISIKSTVVGIFSNIQVNGIPLLIKEGDNIEVGQKVGQVEAMKLIKDVCSTATGKVLKVLISNGQTVEYGQELFILECSQTKPT
jgi:acetyl-CoA carboxylase biotin carboxyl carrier protein